MADVKSENLRDGLRWIRRRAEVAPVETDARLMAQILDEIYEEANRTLICDAGLGRRKPGPRQQQKPNGGRTLLHTYGGE